MSKHTKQLGSIRTFFIVGVVLTCLLIGSLVYVKNRGESIQKNESNTTNQTQNDEKKDDSSKDTTDKDVDFGPDTSTSSDTSKDSSADKNTSSESSELPTTGSESVIFSMIIVFVLTVGVLEFAYHIKTKNTSFDL